MKLQRLLALTVCLIPSSLSYGENWAGWRGPYRNAVSSETNIPLQWSEREGVRWQTSVAGVGISSPIIWDDQIFVTSSSGLKQDDLHVFCFSRHDGSQQWQLQLWGSAPTRHHATKSSMASPTPVTDGQHVYVFFGTGDVFCLDMSGGLVWHRSLASEYGRFENRFSATSSPLLHDDLLILQCDHYGDSYLLALNKVNGTNEWKVDRPDEWLSWSSPQLVPVARGGHELLLCGSLKIDAFDPGNGQKLWTVAGLQQECIPTPVFGHGLIYAVSGPGGKTLAIRPGGQGDVAQTHVKWESTRGVPFVPSAILVGELYFLVDDAGIATCLDAHTGQRLWQKRLPGRFTASPVAAGNRIYFCNESGETIVIEARRRYTQVARNRLAEPIFASPAVSQGSLFLRTTSRLLCIDGNEQSGQ